MFCQAKLCEAAPIGTAFTYQGHLYDANYPANDIYDFQFKLYDALTGGSQIDSDINVPDLDVIDGSFTIDLDFGSNAFTGNARWLEIAVRPGSSTDRYTTLTPRQEVTPTPYALYSNTAGTADHGSLTGLLDDDHPQYVLEGETDSISTSMLQSQVVTIDKISGSGGGSGQVMKSNGSSMYWASDETGGGTLWQSGGGKIWYTGGYVGIGTSDPHEELEVVGEATVTGELEVGGGAIFDGDSVLMKQGLIVNWDATIKEDLEVYGTKNFKIDHPLDPATKYLRHSCIESSEMLNIYSGVAKLNSSGEAQITLPEWFDVLNRDFRYQLTAIGASMPGLYIAEEIQDNCFKIAGGKAGKKVSWQVTGVRNDAYAKAHPLQVEEEKPAEECGYYLHPELYGQPEEKSILARASKMNVRVARDEKGGL